MMIPSGFGVDGHLTPRVFFRFIMQLYPITFSVPLVTIFFFEKY